MTATRSGGTTSSRPGATEDEDVTKTGAGWARFAPLAAVVAMLVAGVWGLGRKSSMGNDEVATHYAASLKLGQLAHLLNHVDAVHGLYYFLMHFWIKFGSSPAFMRIPSVVSMVVAAGVVAILTRRLTRSAWAALFAGLIMAITPTVVFYAQTARSYAMVYLCVAAATLVLIHALKAEAQGRGRGHAEEQGRGRGHAEEQGWGRGHAEEHGRSRFTRLWLLYIPLITLAGYLNEMALLVLTAHAVTVLLARYGRGTFVHWLIAAVIGGVLVAPLGYVSAREDGAVHWIGRPTIGAVRVLFGDYFGAKPVGGIFVFLLAVAGVLPSLSWWRHRRAAKGRATTPAGSVPGDPASGTPGADGTLPWWRQGGLSLQSVALPLLVLPGGLLMLESLVGKALYVDRYVLYGEAGAAMLAGTGIYRVGRWVSVRLDRRALLGVVGVVICACALAIQVNAQHYVRTPRARMFDFGGPAQYVGAHAKPGDGVMFFNLFYRKDRLGYPDDFRNVQDFSMAVSPQVRGNFNGINKPFREVRPLMLRHERIWALGRLPTAHLTGPGVRHEAAVLIRRFTLVETVHFRGFNVSLWVRDS